MTDAIAQKTPVEIALVLAPALAKRGEVSLDFVTGYTEEWPDDAHFPFVGVIDRINPCQTLGPRPPHSFSRTVSA